MPEAASFFIVTENALDVCALQCKRIMKNVYQKCTTDIEYKENFRYNGDIMWQVRKEKTNETKCEPGGNFRRKAV